MIRSDRHTTCNNLKLAEYIWSIIIGRHSISRSATRAENCNRCLSSGQVTHVPQERYLTGEQTVRVIVYLILLSRSKTAAFHSLGVCVKVLLLLNSRLFFYASSSLSRLLMYALFIRVLAEDDSEDTSVCSSSSFSSFNASSIDLSSCVVYC